MLSRALLVGALWLYIPCWHIKCPSLGKPPSSIVGEHLHVFLDQKPSFHSLILYSRTKVLTYHNRFRRLH